MSHVISKSLRWDGSIIVEPRTFDLLKFFAPRDGLRVSDLFAELLPWVVYTHNASCGQIIADCFDLRRTLQEKWLRKELQKNKAFGVCEGLCLVASLIGQQFKGRKGWLLRDGSVNVFLMDMGEQILAVSVSCLDNSGEFFVDDWWPLLDRSGPLRSHDRIFLRNPSKKTARVIPAYPFAGDFPIYMPGKLLSETDLTERRSANREFYLAYGLTGHSLQVYLQRHTVKRFCKGCMAQTCQRIARGDVSASSSVE